MDSFELAGRLFGTRRGEDETSAREFDSTIYGTAVGSSEDGSVLVHLSDDVTAPEEQDGVDVEIPTTVNVMEGDIVTITNSGNGVIGSPRVSGVIGGGDRMAASIFNAESIAEQAEAVANATGQHFWYDEGGDGAHVTQVTREEWDGGTQTGPNSLWNSQGMLFRDGSNDLLTLLPAQRHSETFEGDGTTTTFTLSRTPTSVTSVTIPGVTYAEGTDYTISGSTITFSTAPESGVTITVRYTASVAETFTGDGATTDFQLAATPDAIESVTINDVAIQEADAISVPFSHSLTDSTYWSTSIWSGLEPEAFTLLGNGWVRFQVFEDCVSYFLPLVNGFTLTGGADYLAMVEVTNLSASATLQLPSWHSPDAFDNSLTFAVTSNGIYAGTLTAKADQSAVTRLFYGNIVTTGAASFDMRITIYDSSGAAVWALGGDTMTIIPAPASDSTVAVSYDRSVTDTLAGDGSTTTFALSIAPSEVEFVGVPDEDVTGYTLSNRTLTLTTAPDDGAEVVVNYKTSKSSVTIFDGDGNGEDNITSVFSEDYVRIGGKVPVETDIGGSGASIEFFDQTDTHTSRMDAFTSIVEDTDFYDMRSETSIATLLDDNGRVADTDSNGTASLQLKQELSYGLTDVGEQTSEVTSAIVADATYDADGTNPVTSHAAVRAVALTGSRYSTGYSVVDIVAEQGIGIGTGDAGLTYISTPQVVCALQQPYAMFVGSSGTTTATASGWHTTWFNSVGSHSYNWSGYFSFSNGVITANRNIRLEISGCMNWTDSLAGIRGFGVFFNSSTAGSGSEYSAFQYFPNTVNTRKSVWLTGLVLSLNAGVQCAVGRYEQTNAVYVTGPNFSRIELKVLGTF